MIYLYRCIIISFYLLNLCWILLFYRSFGYNLLLLIQVCLNFLFYLTFRVYLLSLLCQLVYLLLNLFRYWCV